MYFFLPATVLDAALPSTPQQFTYAWSAQMQTASVIISTPLPHSTAREIINSTFKDVPILIEVARCESNYQQFKPDGTVLHGIKDPDDTGVMQINAAYNGLEASRLGYNINTLEGNIEMALYMYRQNGLKPWTASESCWDS